MICECYIHEARFWDVAHQQFMLSTPYILIIVGKYALMNCVLFHFNISQLKAVLQLVPTSLTSTRCVGSTTLISVCGTIELDCNIVFDVSNEELEKLCCNKIS